MEENLVLDIKRLKACIYFDLAISLAGTNLKERIEESLKGFVYEINQ